MSGRMISEASPGRSRRLAIGALLLAFAALPGLSSPATGAEHPTGYNPNGLPTAGCFWTGPFTAQNEKTNIAYPGTEITYWGAKFVTPPGASLTLRGRFPHARYSSFNTYKGDGASSSSLNDRQIRPDRGSANPSLPGRDRRARNRSYTVTVHGEAPPATPARNALYAEPVPGSYQDIIYRVYVPDRGRNLSGGTGLPRPELVMADGRRLTGQALCDALNSIHDYTSPLMNPVIYQTLVNTPGKDPATNPALPEFRFARFFNLPNALSRFGSEADQQAAWAANPEDTGTLYNNSDARYMTGAYSFRYGELLAVHGRMPTTPRTLAGQRRAARGQMVEWDMCVIQSLVTTRTHRCLFDEQIPVRGKRKRSYVIVVAPAEARPRNAIRRCGVAWLPADPAGDGAGRTDAGQLLTRNILSSPGFRRSIWQVTTPFNAASTMARFYPRGRYMGKRQFESRGCPFRWR